MDASAIETVLIILEHNHEPNPLFVENARDEYTALRARVAELEAGLGNLAGQFDERGHYKNTHANVMVALLDARALLEKK